ncbi:MAG: hypothetical protein K8963_01065 [Proteobacteria bacterium]|nr:hypothetical protein [Pseudomonadota bacterium]
MPPCRDAAMPTTPRLHPADYPSAPPLRTTPPHHLGHPSTPRPADYATPTRQPLHATPTPRRLGNPSTPRRLRHAD